MKRKQPFWVRLFSPVKLKTQRIDKAGSHPRVRLAAFNVFVGVGSFLVAFVLGSFLLIPGDSNAEESIATLSNDPALAVAITPENLNLSITPTPSGALSADELNINVNTDNETGYVMSLASANETTDLTDVNTSSSIHSTTATTDNPAVLSANTWGWYPNSLVNNPGYNNSNPSDSNYQFAAIPPYDDPYTIKQTNTATSDSGDNIPVSIAANVDTSLPAGAYSNIITITTITNYVPRPILDVYPTTGWAGDTITLYSNDGFINVTSVTVGGTECTSINLISQDELQCVLPDKAETNPGSDNGYNITVAASGTELDTHNFTIRYFNPSRTETASVSNTQITNINMDTFTSIDCGSLSVGDIVSLTDERNGQTYRIKKMQDNKCWMVDNMKYLGEGITISNVDGTQGITYNNTDGKYNTVDGTTTQSSTNSDKAFYNNPMSASYCYGTSIQSSYTKCGYLYNWYAATAGTGTYATSTWGTNVSGSICPTGWRLPSGSSDGSTATGNGTSDTAADFPVLNASMDAGSLTTGSTSSYLTGWLFTGAWSGVFSGRWVSGFGVQGSVGEYWSSSAHSSTNVLNLFFNSSSVSPGNSSRSKYFGFAIRCVMDSETPGVQITYNANGGYFDNDPSKTTELITYQIEGSTETKIAKTSNISDDGIQDGGYGDNVENIQTVSFPGASSLKVTVTYQTESTSYDWLAIYDGSVTPTRTNYADSITGKLGGSTKVNNAVFTIPGDTAQFYFRSDSSGSNYYGYYAQVQAEGESLVPSAELQTPTRPGYAFVGWYTDAAGTAGNEFVPNANMESGTTVYAKWTKDPITIVFNGNGNTGGSMANQEVAYGSSVALNTNAYIKSGYGFIGWNTEADGSGTTYKDGATYRYTSSIGSDTLTLYAQWAAPITITYDGNGGSGSVSSQTVTYGNNVTPNKNNYTKSGYVFNGWTTNSDGSGGAYSSTYPVSYDNLRVHGTNITFYARWAPVTSYNMQNFTKSQCQSLASSNSVGVKDLRDNKIYTVRYINDECWMTQNLRLAPGTTVTSTYSNVSENFTLPTNSTVSSDSLDSAFAMDSGDEEIGVWYNYYAATAGTIFGSSNTTEATYDICPKGWKLPSFAQVDALRAASQRYGATIRSAFYIVAGGYYTINGVNSSTYGYWWSSTAYNALNRRVMYFSPPDNLNQNYFNRDNGMSIRCVRSS